jgi:hypothetical protein
MPDTLLGTIARHPLRREVDEHENRLTAVLGAVLRHEAMSGVCVFLLDGWLSAAAKQNLAGLRIERLRERLASGNGWHTSVRTEAALVVDDQPRRVDLEIRLQSSDLRTLRIWLEIKHGTDPHSGQLFDYVEELAKRGGDAVLLIAPRSDLPFDQVQIPPNVAQLSWQDTARILKSFSPESEVETFLLNELLSYLHEEGLVDPDRITPEHLVALSHYHEANTALGLVCAITSDLVRLEWGDAEAGRRSGVSTWTYQWRPGDEPPPGFAPRWMWWQDAPPFFRERPGVGRFTVGLGAETGHLAAIDHPTHEKLEDAGFLILPSGDLRGIDYENIWKMAYPEEILAGADLQAQGEALASWILRNFSELATIIGQSHPTAS